MSDEAPRERKKPGRKPFEWDLEEIENLATIGLYKQEVCETLGCSIQTWYQAIAKGNVEIDHAYQRGWAKHRRIVFGGLVKNATKGDRQCQMFLAKAHFGRRENINLLVQGDPENPVAIEATVKITTPEERAARLAALEAKRKGLTDAKDQRDEAPAGSEQAGGQSSAS